MYVNCWRRQNVVFNDFILQLSFYDSLLTHKQLIMVTTKYSGYDFNIFNSIVNVMPCNMTNNNNLYVKQLLRYDRFLGSP